MDEVLRSSGAPRRLMRGAKTDWRKRSSAAVSAAADVGVLVRRGGGRVLHLLRRVLAGRVLRALLPVLFLLAAGAVGAWFVVSTVYTPSYIVSVDGTVLGTVADPAEFHAIVDRVEARAAMILEQDYQIKQEIVYEYTLTERDKLSPQTGFETYLFSGITDIKKTHVLTVDGVFIGSHVDRTVLDAMLAHIQAPYMTEDTVSAMFTADVRISYEYVSADLPQEPGAVWEMLNTTLSGDTTYTAVKGDTYSGIAFDNDMSLGDLVELNPGLDLDRLMVGDVVIVKETVPFLSVVTTDRVTYHDVIPAPVERVKDDTMYQGVTKVIDAGADGEALVTADITYRNGREQERVIQESVTLTEPLTKVIAEGTMPRPKTMPKGYFIWPVYGTITSRFGYRSIFGTYSYHSGLDIATSYGTTIVASDGGTVTFSGYKGSYGNLVIIDHGGGTQTYYGHCSSLLVSAGQKVYQGQAIARVGSTGRSTGNHCHFEIKVNGTSVNPAAHLN